MTQKALKTKQKNQPKAVQFLSEAERATIKQTVAKNLNDSQYSVFIYTCQALGLNPLLNEIFAISYAGTMSIQVARDGFLTIAHRSGKFAGLESGVKEEGTKKLGWAKVYHKDFLVPVYQEADFNEYNTGKNLWVSKPNTMIKKVAEAMALRKAFNINGVYSPEEMEKEIDVTPRTVTQPVDDGTPAIQQQKDIIKNFIKYKDLEDADKATADEWINDLTFQQAASKIQELAKGKK